MNLTKEQKSVMVQYELTYQKGQHDIRVCDTQCENSGWDFMFDCIEEPDLATIIHATHPTWGIVSYSEGVLLATSTLAFDNFYKSHLHQHTYLTKVAQVIVQREP